jgi:hypothetical protein
MMNYLLETILRVAERRNVSYSTVILANLGRLGLAIHGVLTMNRTKITVSSREDNQI